jgi:transketolase
MHYQSKVGHIGGNLSCLDILLVLHHHVLRPCDSFVLSKGHAAGALYITLWTLGAIPEEELMWFHKDNTRLSGHPPCQGIAEIPFATGSLGHGPALSAGLALAKRLRGEAGRVFCLTSDGEWNEGACWETLIFARQQDLRITIVVDTNGLQGFGTTREVANLEPLAARFEAFGVQTSEVDGHDPEALSRTLADNSLGPRVVVARTHKGCGVSFMEDRMEWHYLPLNEGQYAQAVEECE